MLVQATERQAEIEAQVAEVFIKNTTIPSIADESNNQATRIADFSDMTNDIKIENLLNLNLELVG